jgi:serine protease Do
MSRACSPRTLLTFACLAVLSFDAQHLRAENPDLLHELNGSLQRVVAKVSPTVVQIRALGEETNGFLQANGSGVVVDPNGFIVTNFHVIDGARRIQVTLDKNALPALTSSYRKDAGVLEASVVGAVPEADFAVLKVNARDLPTLDFGQSTALRQGQLVIALGSPMGLRNSVSMGIISSVERQVDEQNPLLLIQTDAAINAGSSGGPLVDIDGRLVGINTFIITAGGGNEGLGFAIPSNMVRFFYEQIIRTDAVRHGRMGAAFQDVTPILAAGLKLSRPGGIVTAEVTPGDPAERAGLRVRDLILTFNGKPIQSLPYLTTAMYYTSPGDIVDLTGFRGSEPISLRITLKTSGLERHNDPLYHGTSVILKLGLLCADVRQAPMALAAPLQSSAGVVVIAARTMQRRFDVDLNAGDVIHAVNLDNVTSVDQLRTSLDKFRSGDPVVLQVEREGRTIYVGFEMDGPGRQ